MGYKNNIKNFVVALSVLYFGEYVFLNSSLFKDLSSFPFCFDQSPVCYYKMIFHPLLQSIMYGFCKINIAHL